MRAWREARGLSRRQLAQRLDISEGTVYRWETGSRKIPERMLKLALWAIDRDAPLDPPFEITPAGGQPS